eukprot:CAMPEP_0206256190 /NCGR_PEP_ID=MMETSP0047_2-20121206/24636_1 /ASSEMBLY_ACC=CAM_ASM_000192 /TAXON_ID=195065 /ORGANISM="Chroomonas mesostigmatica_cf, Strain CCMP1168" /LENGTH=411 /DNA_ID=CAMNT_0053682615 /DNA_START=6 /DNA_END=1241 /DNA_ORIENTATION=+
MPMEGNVGLAFGMTIGAGMCTTLGASLAFCVPVQNKRFLAVSLAIAAGVMVYVSMVEIFFKALSALSDEWCPERAAGDVCARAYGATTGFFFAGLALCAALNVFTHNLEHMIGWVRSSMGWGAVRQEAGVPMEAVQEREEARTGPRDGSKTSLSCEGSVSELDADSTTSMLMPGNAIALPPHWTVHISERSGRPFFENIETGLKQWSVPTETHMSFGIEASSAPVHVQSDPFGLGASNSVTERDIEVAMGTDEQADMAKKKLMSTGLLTGVAIAIHNFPEGLATFVAAMADPSLGAAIAVAIAIHNIPEGVCVAMPVYYATGSKLRAFFWATLSGVSEPIGALFGWAVLAGDVSNMAYGAMFGLVAGMMVYILLVELLPAAYSHDHNPVIITSSLLFGMVAMALSLVLFVV